MSSSIAERDVCVSFVRKISLLIWSVLFVATAFGQESTEVQDDDDDIEVIIVTAEKREENILEVPVTMSALGAEALRELGLTGDEDLEQLVPGLQYAYDSEGNGISIRGIGTQKAVQTQADAAVAFYVDGVYSYKTYGIAPNFFDLERVEVARGPQGTLNGRNSIAGAVSFVTKKPTADWDVNVFTEYTDQMSQRYGLAVGGPINEEFMFRLTGSYYEGDGAQENTGTGGDYNAPDQTTFSPQLRFVNERVEVNARYMKLLDQGSSRARVSLTEKDRTVAKQVFFGFWEVHNAYFLYDKPVPSVKNCPPGQFSDFGGICGDLRNAVLSNRASQQDNEADRWSLNLDFSLNEFYTLRYTYGGNESHTFGSEDGDGTDRTPSADDPSIPSDLDAAEREIWIAEGGRFQDTEDAWLEDDEESSHELQVFSDFAGPFNFVAGYYTYKNESSWRDRQHNWANPLNFTNAEEAVALIDRDLDGQPDYSSCDDFFNRFVLGEDDPSTPDFVEGIEEDPEVYKRCQPGDNHEFQTGGGAGAAAGTSAFFVSAEYRFNEQLQISGGLRWTEDTKELLADINGDHGVTGVLSELDPSMRLSDAPWGGVPIYFEEVLPVRSGTWDAVIGHLSIEYSPQHNRLYYGRISTGFRAGGFNQISGITSEDLINNVVPPSFPGEELINYEVGIKGLFLENRLLLTAGAYFQDFQKFHLNATQFIDESQRRNRDSPFAEFTDSIRGTEIWGAEVEGSLQLTETVRLIGFYNYLDSSVGSHLAFFEDNRDEDRPTFEHSYVDPETGEMIVEELEYPRDVTGNQLPQQPNHKMALSVNKTWLLGVNGIVDGVVSWSFTGDRWADIGNVPYQKLNSYDRLDVRLGWTSSDSVWNVTGYVQNLMDEIGIQEFAYEVGWLTEARQIGLQVRWNPSF